MPVIDAARFGEERVRPAFDRLPILAKREVIGALFASLRLGPHRGHGKQAMATGRYGPASR